MSMIMKILAETAEYISTTKPHIGDAGFDVRCSEAFTLAPRSHSVIPSKARVKLPEGTFALLVGRSGLAKKGILIHSGTIDNLYTGVLGPLAFNMTDQPIHFEPGDRVAQLLILPLLDVQTEIVPSLDQTSRGENGFGSSGMK